MFNFLKDKLKSAIESITKKVDKEAEVVEEIKEEVKEPVEPEVKEPEKHKEPVEEIKPEEKPAEEPEEELVVEKKPIEKEPKEATKPEKKPTFFEKIKEKVTKKRLNEKQFEQVFWDLEQVLLQNNVAIEVIDKIRADLKNALVDKAVEKNQVDKIIVNSLRNTIEDLFDVEKINLLSKVNSKKPYVICFVGINGSGKTTTLAKIAYLLQKNGLSCVFAAADTFRAAAIQQLEEHAKKLGVKMIKHDYGADAAAVAFDAIKHAQAHNVDVVLIDTAGRLHSNVNLMDEMKKVKRVTNPDLVLFVGESITGNDCVEQARQFDAAVGINAIILTKADVDEKGGAAISISYVTKKPIIYLATGQKYEDLVEFDPKLVVESLGLAS